MSTPGVSPEQMERLLISADEFGRRGGLFLDGWFLVDAMIKNTAALADIDVDALSPEQVSAVEQRVLSAADSSPSWDL